MSQPARPIPVGQHLAVWLAVAATALSGGRLWPQAELLPSLFLALASALLLPRAIAHFNDQGRDLKLATSALLLIMLICAAFSLDPQRAWFGSLERSQGAFTLLSALALCFANISRRALFAPIAATMVAQLGFLIYQTSIDSSWHSEAWPGRFAGSFGNPAQLGNWALLALLYLLMVRSDELSVKRNWLGITGAVTLIAVSGARAAWCGALFAVLIVFLQSTPWSARVRLIVVIGTVTLCASILILFRPESVWARLTIWQELLQLDPANTGQIWLRFLFGLGFDLQAAALNGVASQSEFADRAHSMIFDSYLTMGAVGSLTLSIWVWQLVRVSASKTTLILASIGVSLLFSFLLSAELALLALLLACQLSNKCSSSAKRGSTNKSAESNRTNHRSAALLITFALTAVLVSYLPISALTTPHWRRVEYGYQEFRLGVAHFERGDAQRAQHHFYQAELADRYRLDYRRAVELEPSTQP